MEFLGLNGRAFWEQSQHKKGQRKDRFQISKLFKIQKNKKESSTKFEGEEEIIN